MKHLLTVLLTMTLGLGSTAALASPSSQKSGPNTMQGMQGEQPGTKQMKKKTKKKGKKKARRTSSSRAHR